MPAILSLIQQVAANHKRDYQASLFSLFDSTPNSNCDVEAAPQSTSAHCAVCEAANHSFQSGFYREIFPIEHCGTPSLLLSDGSQRQLTPGRYEAMGWDVRCGMWDEISIVHAFIFAFFLFNQVRVSTYPPKAKKSYFSSCSPMSLRRWINLSKMTSMATWSSR